MHNDDNLKIQMMIFGKQVWKRVASPPCQKPLPASAIPAIRCSLVRCLDTQMLPGDAILATTMSLVINGGALKVSQLTRQSIVFHCLWNTLKKRFQPPSPKIRTISLFSVLKTLDHCKSCKSPYAVQKDLTTKIYSGRISCLISSLGNDFIMDMVGQNVVMLHKFYPFLK